MWYKLFLYFASMRAVQTLMLSFRANWVAVRKNDRRFVQSNVVRYGNCKVLPKETIAVFKLAKSCSPAYIAIDDATGQRLACLGRLIHPGEKIALKIGREDAGALFLAPKNAPFPPIIKLLAKCNEANLTLAGDNKPAIL